MKVELQTLIEQYRSAWQNIVRESGDVGEVNQFFHLPCVFLGADGIPSVFQTAEDISTFHLPRLKLFHELGVWTPVAKDFEITPLGKHSALVLVTWEQGREDGSIALAWRHSYNAISTATGWKILLSTFQTEY